MSSDDTPPPRCGRCGRCGHTVRDREACDDRIRATNSSGATAGWPAR